MALLKEEGSSIAFPEALDQVREDMIEVVSRLAEAKVDDLTVDIEQDIIDALTEMIDALKKAQEDLQKRQRQRQQQGQQGPPQDPTLVDQIAELKMILALQKRINRRTLQYAKASGVEEDQVGQVESGEEKARSKKLYRRAVLRSGYTFA